MKFTLTSSAFSSGQKIPKRYTGDGADVSPALSWGQTPAGTKELALICDDPDAPTPEPWVHWVLYAIPATVTSLAEGIDPTPRPASPAEARQGKNSWDSGRTIGYRGPAPPPGHGVHHYHFRLYALDARLDLAPGRDKQQLLKTLEGHVLAEAELVGVYQR